MMSYLMGRALAFWIWPKRVAAFQKEIAKRRSHLLNYMVFLRITPFVPNVFINITCPIVNVPYRTFALGTFLGTLPNNFIAANMVGRRRCKLDPGLKGSTTRFQQSLIGEKGRPCFQLETWFC